MKCLCWSDKCSGGGKQHETNHNSQAVSVNTQWAQLLCNRSPLSETWPACPQKPLSKRCRGSWERAHGRPVEHSSHFPRLETHDKRKLQLEPAWKCLFLLICWILNGTTAHKDTEKQEKKQTHQVWSDSLVLSHNYLRLGLGIDRDFPIQFRFTSSQFDLDSDLFGYISVTLIMLYVLIHWKIWFTKIICFPNQATLVTGHWSC